eukprot:TRINITY_DN3205_c0_g6_i1.p1 TRINITY_DN3205_c0_g6~~TRINITY_DN3205_c0_g6_i1.p1  ORF type:complete len:403 (+),score=75.63 TRINITY_DN3205_c0_g6_i1:393-1601(+)
MEYCDAVLEEMIPELSLKEKLVIMMQVSSTLEFCHMRGVMHRDLKPNNVLLRRDSNGVYTPAIADFALVRDVSRSSANSMMRAIRYVAPELADQSEYVKAMPADVWSFGVMMTQVVSGFVPFEGLTDFQVAVQLSKGQLPYARELLDTIPGFGIIKQCLAVEPSERPTFSEITEYLQMLVERFEGFGCDQKRLLNENNALKEEKRTWLLEKTGYEQRVKSLTQHVDELKEEKEMWVNKEKELITQSLEFSSQIDRLTKQLNELMNNNDGNPPIENRKQVIPVKSVGEEPVFSAEFPDTSVNGLAYSSDGRFFAVSGSCRNRLKVYNTKTHEIVHEGVYAYSYDLNFSPDSKLLAVGDFGRAIHIIEVDTWRTVRVIRGMARNVRHVWFSPDEKLLFFGMLDG